LPSDSWFIPWQLSAVLFNHFDRIRVVSLPHRKDRRSEMLAQFAKVGLRDDPRIEFFDALSFSDPGPFLRRGSHGNFKSRIPLLREAGEARESILIFEDDCDFRVPQILEYEMPAEWDIFYGGFTASEPDDLSDSQIIGSHFMGFSPRAAMAAAEYLAAYLEPDFPPDPRAASEPGFDPAIKPPIDGAFVWLRRSRPYLVTVFADLGYQRSSRTDVGAQKWFDRIIGVRELVGLARRILRRLRGLASA
jgi:glycosyl transferase family 25